MKSRLFESERKIEVFQKAIRSQGIYDHREPITFDSLSGRTVIEAKVSDHHPMIHNGILFWNVMMRCDLRKSKEENVKSKEESFNNAFGIIEKTDKKYIARLEKIALVISELVDLFPTIDAICLCEGPIKPQHVTPFLAFLKEHRQLKKFFIDSPIADRFFSPEKDASKFGLMMLVNKVYKVKEVPLDFSGFSLLKEKLANRLQLWKIEQGKQIKYIAQAHFPFGKGVEKRNQAEFSGEGLDYCNYINAILKKYENTDFTFCADFNFNPHLIGLNLDRTVDQIIYHNSVLFERFKPLESQQVIIDKRKKEAIFRGVTVDGTLLSKLSKQKLYTHFYKLNLFKCSQAEKKLLSGCLSKMDVVNNDYQKVKKSTKSITRRHFS